jgi:hypothetical protein
VENNDKNEILSAIAALGERIDAADARNAASFGNLAEKIDLIANGVGRIEADVATVKLDVLQIRIDLAAYRLQSDARLTALEAKS